jgi:rhodanese-related sulfurtransferase
MPYPVVTLAQLLHKQREGDLILAEGSLREEFERGHLPGAINIPLTEVRELIPRLLPADTQAIEIVTYGAHERSPTGNMLLMALHLLGYTRSSFYAGGKEGWRAAGRELEKGPAQAQAPTRHAT